MKKQLYFFSTLIWVFIFSLNIFGQLGEVPECEVLYPIKNVNGKGGYIDCKGDVIVKPQFMGVREFSDGIGVIHTQKGDGFVDLQGKITVFNNTELFSSTFSEGLAFGLSKGVLGYIDKKGNIAIKLPQYAEKLGFLNFSEGIGAIQTNDKYYFINKQGNVAIEKGFDSIEGKEGFVGGIATVGIDGKFAVINRSGKYIVKPQNEYISHPSDGLVNLRCRNKIAWIYLDKNGNTTLKVQYDYAGSFVEGLAEVEVGGKWGYMDKTGKIVIAPQFGQVQEFSEGLAAVQLNGKLGFINKKGELVISTAFDYIPVEMRFRGGLAYIYTNDVEGYIDKTGKWIWKKPDV